MKNQSYAHETFRIPFYIRSAANILTVEYGTFYSDSQILIARGSRRRDDVRNIENILPKHIVDPCDGFAK